MTSLKNLLNKIGDQIHSIFHSVSHELQTVLIPAAVKVTTELKNITDLDSLDIIGHLAGAAGPAAEDKIREVLPTVIADLQIAQVFLASNPRADNFIDEVVKIGLSLKGDAKTNFLIEFSGKLAKAVADGNLTVATSISLTQEVYLELYKPTTPTTTP